MPQDRQMLLHFAVILLVVPVQYFIVTYFGSTGTQKNQQLEQLISLASKYKTEYLSWETWQKWCYDVLKRVAAFRPLKSKTSASNAEDDSGESVAIEVLRYRNPLGFYGTSVEPRSPRPQQVKYRVGQVIRHKVYNYKGVIIGWDPTGKAPDGWFEKSHSSKAERQKNQPNYAVLVDMQDRSKPQMTYVPEEVIEILKNTKVFHPDLESYFEGFDGVQYLLRPRLKVLYPHD